MDAQVLSQHKGLVKESENFKVEVLHSDDESYQALLKTKQILREFSPLNNMYLTSAQLYNKALTCSNEEDFQLFYNHIVNSSNARYVYQFANYFADRLSLRQMRESYKALVDMNNEKYIYLFIKNVLPKINSKDYEEDRVR